ncbi:N-6 DNA methylase [Streptomyces sp. NBC_00059]|uniref:N-6 DNA methylase n=1 Tax=Streptomyces sp. NBC_00059 TaxID=2975635 RepID=UPI0022548F9E|nr:N-6 DNA methylase [Streptomyces sp. NBC_00059]MCX5412059.1 N-6 DNA methylase [Streptomyces sp. NBC_00059]
MPENSTEVTAAGIARLAGVGRAAVSNWRRRHADFPKPVGGTEASPSFALPEVEQWLRDQGKLAEVPLRERVWQQLTGHPGGAVTALVHAGCALLLVRDRPTAWLEITAVSDARMAGVLPGALDHVLADRFGEGRAVPTPTEQELLPSVPLLRAVGELAAESGARQAFDFLFGRQLDANPRQYTLTPPGLAELMADLAEPPRGARQSGRHPSRTVLDPAAGTGALLRAVGRPTALYAQETDPDLAALTALRLALHAGGSGEALAVRTGDTLRADAFPRLTVDAVLCHPPFNERNWGHDELAYDPRWEYGFPARTESELAWVQHALAHLREGGTAVVLMPPAAASRRSGRRIRADLLRRGALRAVIALPAGAAPPYGIPLHIWVLRKPGSEQPPAPELLVVDTAEPEPAGAPTGRDRLDWPAVRAAVLDAWTPFDAPGRREPVEEHPGTSRAVPVIELLDDDVDLAPARHLPPRAAGGGAAELVRVRQRLDDTLKLTSRLTPPPAVPGEPARRPFTTVGELARAGALHLRTGTGASGGTARVLTEHDVLAGTAPSGTAPSGTAPSGTAASTGTAAAGAAASSGAAAGPAHTASPDAEPLLLEEGDVVVPVLGGGSMARVVDQATAGAALGRNLQLLRPDPAALDPWFLAGFLRATANSRQASSYASTAARLDARRLQVPRLPLDEQRRYGEQFSALAAFEDALRTAGRLGGQLVQGMYDGLTEGTVAPE